MPGRDNGFVDADLESFSSSYVTGLLGPLLTDRSVALVKAVYDRPLRSAGEVLPAGGGRVTVSGEVTGNLRATERVELKRTARVYGDVEAPIVVVEEGVIFEGHCRMAKPTPVAEVAAARDLAVVPLKR